MVVCNVHENSHSAGVTAMSRRVSLTDAYSGVCWRRSSDMHAHCIQMYTHTRVHTHTHTLSLTHTHTHTYTHRRIHTHPHAHTRAHTHKHVAMCLLHTFWTYGYVTTYILTGCDMWLCFYYTHYHPGSNNRQIKLKTLYIP
jgi:hypothetical protein